MKTMIHINNQDDYLALEKLLKTKALDGLMVKEMSNSFLYFEESTIRNFDFKVEYKAKKKRDELKGYHTCIDNDSFRVSYKDETKGEHNIYDYKNVFSFKLIPMINMLVFFMMLSMLEYTKLLNNASIGSILVAAAFPLIFYSNKIFSYINYKKFTRDNNYYIKRYKQILLQRNIIEMIKPILFTIILVMILERHSLIIIFAFILNDIISHYLIIKKKSNTMINTLLTILLFTTMITVFASNYSLFHSKMSVENHLDEISNLTITEYKENIRPVLKLSNYYSGNEINYVDYHSNSILIDDYYFFRETHRVEGRSEFGKYNCSLRHTHYVETERFSIKNEYINEVVYKELFDDLSRSSNISNYHINDVSDLYKLDKVAILGTELLIKHKSLIIRCRGHIDYLDEKEIDNIKRQLGL